MTKKQTAALVGPVLAALAVALSQCPDDAPAPSSPPLARDAGTRPPAKAQPDAGSR